MTVSGCGDCPLYGSEYGDCQHPEAGARQTDVTMSAAPSWCPLQKGDLVLHLEAPPCKWEAPPCKVKGCDDCPLMHESGIEPWCGHRERAGWASVADHLGLGTAPHWCPLRTAPLTIALEGHESDYWTDKFRRQDDARRRGLLSFVDGEGVCWKCAPDWSEWGPMLDPRFKVAP